MSEGIWGKGGTNSRDGKIERKSMGIKRTSWKWTTIAVSCGSQCVGGQMGGGRARRCRRVGLSRNGSGYGRLIGRASGGDQ